MGWLNVYFEHCNIVLQNAGIRELDVGIRVLSVIFFFCKSKIKKFLTIFVLFSKHKILQTNQAHPRRVTYWVGLPATRHVQILDKAENSFNWRPSCSRSARAGVSIADTALALSRSSVAGRGPALTAISSAAMSGGVTDRTGSLLRSMFLPSLRVPWHYSASSVCLVLPSGRT